MPEELPGEGNGGRGIAAAVVGADSVGEGLGHQGAADHGPRLPRWIGLLDGLDRLLLCYQALLQVPEF